MKTILVTGLDGSGKSTFFSRLDAVKKSHLAILNIPEIDASLYNTDKETYKVGNFINKLSEHATKTQQPFIKGLALFTAMLYFKDFYEQLKKKEVQTIFCERHPLIDTTVYAKFYVPKLDPSGINQKEFKNLDNDFKEDLINILYKIKPYGITTHATISETICYFIYNWFHVKSKLEFKYLTALFKASVPEHIYFLEADPKILMERIKTRKYIEPHEQVNTLKALNQTYSRILHLVKTQFNCKITIVDAAKIEELDRFGTLINTTYNTD